MERMYISFLFPARWSRRLVTTPDAHAKARVSPHQRSGWTRSFRFLSCWCLLSTNFLCSIFRFSLVHQIRGGGKNMPTAFPSVIFHSSFHTRGVRFCFASLPPTNIAQTAAVVVVVVGGWFGSQPQSNDSRALLGMPFSVPKRKKN